MDKEIDEIEKKYKKLKDDYSRGWISEKEYKFKKAEIEKRLSQLETKSKSKGIVNKIISYNRKLKENNRKATELISLQNKVDAGIISQEEANRKVNEVLNIDPREIKSFRDPYKNSGLDVKTKFLIFLPIIVIFLLVGIFLYNKILDEFEGDILTSTLVFIGIIVLSYFMKRYSDREELKRNKREALKKEPVTSAMTCSSCPNIAVKRCSNCGVPLCSNHVVTNSRNPDEIHCKKCQMKVRLVGIVVIAVFIVVVSYGVIKAVM